MGISSFLGDIGNSIFGSGGSTGANIGGLGALLGGALNLGSNLINGSPQQQATTNLMQALQTQLGYAGQNQSQNNDTLNAVKALIGQSTNGLNTVSNAAMGPLTTARGDVISYNPQTGYTPQLSDRSNQILNASDANTLATLLQELPQEQAGQNANFARRGQESSVASGMLGGVNQQDPYNLQSMTDNLTQQALAGVANAYKDETGRLEGQALRSGTSAEPIVNALMHQRSLDTTNAILQAQQQGISNYNAAETGFQGQQTSRVGNYNTIANRASNVPTTANPAASFAGDINNETNVARGSLPTAGTANAAIGQAGAGLGQAGAQLSYANSTPFNSAIGAAGTANTQLANTPSTANDIGGFLSGVGSLFGANQLGNKGATPTSPPVAGTSLNSPNFSLAF